MRVQMRASPTSRSQRRLVAFPSRRAGTHRIRSPIGGHSATPTLGCLGRRAHHPRGATGGGQGGRQSRQGRAVNRSRGTMASFSTTEGRRPHACTIAGQLSSRGFSTPLANAIEPVPDRARKPGSGSTAAPEILAAGPVIPPPALGSSTAGGPIALHRDVDACEGRAGELVVGDLENGGGKPAVWHHAATGRRI